MNTLHRKMFESLPYEEFKEFCRIPLNYIYNESYYVDYETYPCYIIVYSCINWTYTPQGFEYWARIYERLANEGK